VKKKFARLAEALIFFFSFQILAGAGSADAAELRGKVIGVAGPQIRVRVEGDLLPRTGDEVRVSFQLPGGPLVRVGTWKVSEVRPEFIEATLVEATGKPAVDQIATIDSPNPARWATTTGSVPAPGARSYIGVAIRDVNEDERKSLGVESGVLVQRVAPGSPAGQAGLKPGDVILDLNGRPVIGRDLVTYIGFSVAGQTLVLRVLRAGTTRDYNVTVGSPPQRTN
jgi:S1-C subfamily serine protease